MYLYLMLLHLGLTHEKSLEQKEMFDAKVFYMGFHIRYAAADVIGWLLVSFVGRLKNTSRVHYCSRPGTKPN